MKNTIFEQMGGAYHQQGGYLLPDLAAPEEVPVGVWGQRHLRYLREHRRGIYTGLLLSGKLNSYLADIDKQAQERFDILVRQMAERQGVGERLKAADQMAWVGAMNSIRTVAIEIVDREIIYQ